MPANEIGSEFHSMPCGSGGGVSFPSGVADSVLTFSGRTAIETVLKNEPGIRKALLPSYCCDSMIEPFRKADVSFRFFSVKYDNGLKIDVELSEDIDCVLWCNYFGFEWGMPNFTSFIDRGGIVIEDITHSFFSCQQYHPQSSYLVASLRKWGPLICGGYCANVRGQFHNKPLQEPPADFLSAKRQMMELKKDYLNGTAGIPKDQFLAGFSNSNSWLASNYSGLKIDQESERYLLHVNWRQERIQRINNAKRLYHGIKAGHDIAFLFPEDKMGCPLFVPIVVLDGRRDALRKTLIDYRIYCPIHWPHPNEECNSNIYNLEISLICDQRYCETDMDDIVSVVNNFCGTI